MNILVYFDNIKDVLIKELSGVQTSIKVVVAWFTDYDLFSELIEKAKLGVQIDIMLLDDDINRSSKIHYDEILSIGGKLWKIPEEKFNSLMHNKFCIIDKDTIITGSYNWSYKARTNHENITVIKDNHTIIKQFQEEFNRIKFHYFPDLEDNVESTVKNKFLLTHSEFSYSLLKAELQLLKLQIIGLENELAFIKNTISEFTILYDRNLGPLIIELLELQKKIAVNNENNDFTIDEVEEQLNNFKKSYKISTEKIIHNLNLSETQELKTLFRKAIKLCHPDLVDENDKKNATTLFKKIKTLYEVNDLNGIKKIYFKLKQGLFTDNADENTELTNLKLSINRLRIKIDTLEKEICILRKSDVFLTATKIDDKEYYINDMRKRFKAEIQYLRNNYAI